jgi:hypothetical protein
MTFEPSMFEVIKTTLYIAFQDPLRGDLPRQQMEHVRDGILRAPAPAKAIGVRIGLCFRHRLQSLQMQCLLSSVYHDWNS